MTIIINDKLRLDTVPLTDKPIMYNLMQLYLYELSPYSGENISNEGIFAHPYFDDYWIADNRKLLAIRYNEHLAGFVMIRLNIDDTVFAHRVNSIAEYFVMNTYRQRGIGSAVARACWEHYPGTWALMAYTDNTPALAFWHKTINRVAEPESIIHKNTDDMVHFCFAVR